MARNCSIALCIAAATTCQALADGTIRGVGTTPQVFFSQAAAVSADGAVVVGSGHVSGGLPHAWRWTAAGGLQLLGEFPGTFPQSNPVAVSTNGSVIVGTATHTNLDTRAFRWTQAGGLQNLGTLPGTASSLARGMRHDGGVIVGYSGSAKFRWTQATGMQPYAPGVSINAFSRDGQTVVGALGTRAAKWSAAGGTVDLGQPPAPGVEWGFATAVNANGSVVAGVLQGPSGPGFSTASGFRWTAGAGMQGFVGLSDPAAMNADGGIVVGTDVSYVGFPAPIAVHRAALWRAELGAVDLNTWLPTQGVNLAGWTLTSAVGVSDDGLTIAGTGTHNGHSEAWIVTLVQTCYPDCNGDGALNLADFGCFQTKFAFSSLYADCNGDLLLNLADFGCYQTAFALGCP